ncbi:Uncharacterised protein [Brucella melitensis]|nr:Uncharacterised protein [Brucella melitensis]
MAHRLRGGRAAIDVELFLMIAIRAQIGGENAAIRSQAMAFGCFENDRACTITKENAGGAVGPVEDTREGFRTDDQNAPGHAAREYRDQPW